MRLRFTLMILAIAIPLGAQTRPYTAAAGPRPGTIPSGAYVLQPSGALGGAFAGNAMSRPLGGGIVVNGPGGASIPAANHGYRNTGQFRGIAYSSYVPQYVEVPVELPVASLAQPVIINQYFAAPVPPPPAPAPVAVATRPLTPGDLLAPPETYYLIAYRNRSMYAAISWWMENDTLHYVTTQNTHNQASLDLIDLDLTRKLNQDRNVPFATPGR